MSAQGWADYAEQCELAEDSARPSGLVFWVGPALVWHGPYHDAAVLDEVLRCALYSTAMTALVSLARLGYPT